MCVSAPTRLTTFLNSRLTAASRKFGAPSPGSQYRSGTTGREVRPAQGLFASPSQSPGREGPLGIDPSGASALPALDQLVVVDGLAFGPLVLELGPRGAALAVPVGCILRLIETGAAAVVGLSLLVGRLH